MTVVAYMGWTLKCYRQALMRPYQAFTCMAYVRDSIRFNVEGDTAEQAVQAAKDRIEALL